MEYSPNCALSPNVLAISNVNKNNLFFIMAQISTIFLVSNGTLVT
jgi:hypothetical protein